MPHRVPPIARIPLARSLPRLLAWPALVIATGGMAAATWATGSFGAGVGGTVFAALGGFLVVVGLVAIVLLLSIRLEVQEAAVRLSWLGGERVYVLTRGPVTRVRLRGPDASRLRPRLGVFGWALGSARLRDEEEIQVVRLARTRTAILVPTERARLAIAAADEDRLLDALSRAARARQRLEDLTDVGRQAMPRAEQPEPPIAADAAPTAVEVEPRVLTGIERALLEERLAEERARAAAAEAERRAAQEAATGRTAGGLAATTGTVATEVTGERRVEAKRRRGVGLRRPRPSAAFVALPLLGAGAVWGIGLATGTYPAPESDAGRLTALALVLAGPASSVGALMALAWWPRLVGVVVSGGLVAAVFVGRALLG